MKSLNAKHIFFLILLLLTGCAKTSVFISKTSDDGYSKTPKRIFVLTDVGRGFGPIFLDSFKSRLTKVLHNCNTTINISMIPQLRPQIDKAKEEAEQKQNMQDFKADSVLFIKRKGGSRNNVDVFHSYYEISFLDVSIDKTVWVANVDFYAPVFADRISRGTVLADDIIKRMNSDGVLKDCKINE